MKPIYDLDHIKAYSSIAYNYVDEDPPFHIRMKNEMDKKNNGKKVMTCRQLAKKIGKAEQTIKDFRMGSKTISEETRSDIAKILLGDDYLDLLIDNTRINRGFNKLYNDIENDRIKPEMKIKLQKAWNEYIKKSKQIIRSDSCLEISRKINKDNYEDYAYFSICFEVYCRFNVRLMKFLKDLKKLPGILQDIIKDEIMSTALSVENLIEISYNNCDIIEVIKTIKNEQKRISNKPFVFRSSSEIDKLSNEIINKFSLLQFIYNDMYDDFDTELLKLPHLQSFYESQCNIMNENERRNFLVMWHEKVKDIIEYHEVLMQIIPEDWDMIVALILLGINQGMLPEKIDKQLGRLLESVKFMNPKS